MKRLLIDARMIHGMPHGIAKYVEGIAVGLSSLELKYDVTFLVSSETLKSSPVFRFKTIQAQSKFLSPWEWIEIPRVLKQGGFDGFHSPSLSAYPYIPVPYIVTIHDLNHLQYGSMAQKIYYQSLLKYFARNAYQVTTVSEFSKSEISPWLGTTPRPIQIVQNSIETVDIRHWTRPCTAPEGGYFLCIAGEKEHKNMALLRSAYQQYRDQVSGPLTLVTEVPKDADTRELMNWMHFANACFFPSLYEGFGRAPVEAFIAGGTIVVSDIPPHREGLSSVNQSSMTWLNATDIKSWSDALIKFHQAPGIVAKEDERFRLQKLYSPAGCVNQLDPIYRSMLIV